MARKNIKNRTYANFLIVMKEIERKGYDRETAGQLTRNCFDALEDNGGPIWRYVDLIITAEEYEKREKARKYADFVKRGLISMEEALTAVMA